jgi:hypothetical protein
MGMKNFESAIREERDDEAVEPITFKINGEGINKKGDSFRAPEPPTQEQVALLMAAMGRDSSGMDTMEGLTEFLRNVLDTTSWNVLRNRLADPKDPLEIDDMQEIVGWLCEQVTERPTQPRSGSTGSRQSTGRASTRVSR